MLLFKTSGDDTHQTVWLTTPRTFFEFSVEACIEAHIALATTPGVTGAAAYEVILGADGNEMSRIVTDMQTNEIGAEVATPGLLDCSHYKVRRRRVHTPGGRLSRMRTCTCLANASAATF